MLPDVFVVGAYKSGTSALSGFLLRHPAAFLPDRREPNWFAFADLGPDEVRCHPAAARSVTDRAAYEQLYRRAAPDQVRVDVSPEYLTSPTAAASIAAAVPDAKVVAILRNPIERAYSDYLMYRRVGLEPLDDFAAALAEQGGRRSRGERTGHYVETGFYARQVERYIERFPADRRRIYLYDDLLADEAALLTDLCRFLGIDPDARPELERDNVSGVPTNPLTAGVFRVARALPSVRRAIPERLRRRVSRSLGAGLERPELPAAARDELRATYADDVAVLGRLLGRDLGGWLA